MRFAAALTRENGHFILHCLDVDIAGEGATREAALASLERELELYLKETPAVGPPGEDPDIGPIDIVVTENPEGG